MQRILPALSLALVTLAGVALAAAPDESFLAGLRARRLFELAASHCRQLLASAALTDRDRVELSIELARTYAQHAAHTPPQARAPLWTAAQEALAPLRSRMPPPPRAVLLDLQAALLDLARGEIARQEAELGGQGGAGLNDAREALRAAIRQLEALEQTVQRLIVERNRDRVTPPGELAPGELLSLQQHVRLEWARALRNQALCYPLDGPDAVAALTQAVQQLGPVAEVAPPDRLVWQARVETLRCRRLLKDFAGANQAAAALREAKPPAVVRLAVAAEAILLQLDSGQPAQALELVAQGRSIDGETLPELDEAILETYVALWLAAERAQDMARAAELQEVAARSAIAIEQQHGPYWARRAQQALARAAGQSTGAANLDVLERAAANHFRLQRYAEAIAAYDQAAEKAQAANQLERACAFSLAAAAIEHKQGHLTAARDRFRALALRYPRQPEAATAHWNAVLCASLIARQTAPPRFDDYVALLTEHLATFGSSPTADKARWWLGQYREERGDWPAAADLYRALSPSSPEYLGALERLARCHGEILARLARDKKPLAEALTSAVVDLQAVLFGVGPDRRWPEKWSPAQRSAALALARLRLTYDRTHSAEVVTLLEQATRDVADAPADWVLAARATLVVALAGAGRGKEAELILKQLAAGPPKQLFDLVQGLAQVNAGGDAAAQAQLAQLQLAAIGLLVPKSGELAPAEQRTLRRLGAAALAGAGRTDEARREYAALAKEHPQDGAVQQAYAELLEASPDPTGQQQALTQWRLVVERSRPLTERWFQANLGVARTQIRLGQKSEARQFLQLLLVRQPNLPGSWKVQFEELLRASSR